MGVYILRRLLLIIPTLLGIMVFNFIVIQFAPGGPVEQLIAEMSGTATDATAAFSGQAGDLQNSQSEPSGNSGAATSKYRGAQGLDPEIIKDIEKQFGFDKPLHVRFGNMLWDYLLPGRLGSASVFGYAIPGFLFAIVLIIFFAGGRYLDWFPLRGLTSSDWDEMNPFMQVVDYLWHITLPVLAMVISGFASLTMLTKNSFLDQINMQYVQTARAKGLSEQQVLYGHVFRNAMLIVIAGFPSAFIGVLFTGSILIEVIFSLDGLGLLGWESIINPRESILKAGTSSDSA